MGLNRTEEWKPKAFVCTWSPMPLVLGLARGKMAFKLMGASSAYLVNIFVKGIV